MKILNLLVIVPALSLLLLLSGCISQKEAMINQGYPLAYADGYDDGCHSGKQAGGSMFDQFKKDVRRFERDTEYAQGWADGFRQCETEQESLQRQMRISIEQQELAEEREQNKLQKQYHLENIDTSNFKYLK